jgi:tetratricopeptide (TPR) repeat protein
MMTRSHEVIQKNINAIKELILLLKLADHSALEQVVNIDLQGKNDISTLALHYVIWGKYYLMEGSLIKARKYYRKCENSLQKMHPEYLLLPVKNDLASYILYELSTFYRQMYDFDTATKQLNLARSFAETELVIRLIEHMQDTLEIRANLMSAPLTKLNKHIAYFKENSIHRLWLNSMNFRFSIKVQRGNYDSALDDYFDAMALKTKVENETIFSRFEIGMGFMLQCQKEYPKAIAQYNETYKTTSSWYIKSHCLQNLSSISEIYHNYSKAAAYLLDSIKICEQHGVISNIPQDCYLLGQIYEEKLGDLHLAKVYFKKGHDTAIKMQNEGIHLSGLNLTAANNYQSFLNTYSANQDEQEVVDFEVCFGFAKNKSWKEAKAIFQHSLIIYHRQRLSDIYELVSLLDLKINTLGAIQRKLRNMGFALPDKRRLYGKKTVIEGEISLQKYIHLISKCNWNEANSTFERDFLLYLIEKHHGNYSLIREGLEVSYLTMQNMLKRLKSHTTAA